MDSKEKQRLLSLINDYNAHKNKGGRLYEISVETNTKTEFLCRGVLRLYWDTQRPIVLKKEATSSFVQRRSRTSNIVGRPSTARRNVGSQDGKASPLARTSPDHHSPVNAESTCSEDFGGSATIAAQTSPRIHRDVESPPSVSALGSVSALCSVSVLGKSRAYPKGSGGGLPLTRERASTFMGALDMTFRNIRSSSVGSCGSDSLSRSNSKSSLASKSSCSSPNNAEQERSALPSSSDDAHVNSIAADLLQPGGSSNIGGSASPGTSPRARNGSNISRYITSSFRRVKSSPLDSGGSRIRGCPSTAQVFDMTADQELCTGEDPKPEVAKLRKKTSASFRKRRRPSQTALEGSEDAVEDLTKCTKSNEMPEKSSGRISGLLHRHISFRRKSRSPGAAQTPTGESIHEVTPVVTHGPESIAEFYQPPKGSLTNIRATSDMTATEVVEATLNKLNAVDEPSRFAVFSVDDRGTVKLIQDTEKMLVHRIRLGPNEDVVKLFIMERDTNDAHDFSAEVMQYYHLGMPFLERLVLAYEDEEEKEIERIQLRYADLRQRLDKKVVAALEEMEGQANDGVVVENAGRAAGLV